MTSTVADQDAARGSETGSYRRVYRFINFGCMGFVVLVFSVALSRALGIVGLMLPSLFIGVMYLVVTFVLDVVIFFLELRAGARDSRYQRHGARYKRSS